MRQMQLVVKRLIDLVLCSLILIISSPLLLVLAISVKVTSPGPVFFVQERAGRNGRLFKIYKFRSMVNREEAGNLLDWTPEEAARVTSIGEFIRDYGLDELPQLFNILRGDMSIVGPRPPLPERVETYTEYQRRAFDMKPGVLSLAAIKGRRSLPMEERLNLHADYVVDWSLLLDLKIIWGSLWVVLRREDAQDIPTANETTTTSTLNTKTTTSDEGV